VTGKVVGHWPLAVSAVVIIVAFVFSAWSFDTRTRTIDRVLFDQCISNEIQDAVIVAQLEAAKRRARASLPKGSAELQYQMQVLDDGIQALEPADERECKPPQGG